MENFSFDIQRNKSGININSGDVNNENINPNELKGNKKPKQEENIPKNAVTNFTFMRFFGKNLTNQGQAVENKNQDKKQKDNSSSKEQQKEPQRKTSIIKVSTAKSRSLRLSSQLGAKYKSNPQYLIEYIHDIFLHMKETEDINRPKFSENFFSQSKVDPQKRMILLNWLIGVHFRFDLLPETLFLTINLIDRILSKNILSVNNLQLLGVTAMLIASKYEEIYAPEIRDFVYITDKNILK